MTVRKWSVTLANADYSVATTLVRECATAAEAISSAEEFARSYELTLEVVSVHPIQGGIFGVPAFAP